MSLSILERKSKSFLFSLDLINENENLNHELYRREIEVEKLNEAITRINLYETPGIAYTLEQKYLLESKLKELDKENRNLIDERGKLQVELKITTSKYDELKIAYDNFVQETNLVKIRHSDQISLLESRVSELKENYDVLKAQNNSLKNNEQKFNQELMSIKIEKESIEDKYSRSKLQKDDLNKVINELKFKLKEVTMERDMAINDKRKLEEDKRRSNEMKMNYIHEMKNNISNYRSMMMRSRSKKMII